MYWALLAFDKLSGGDSELVMEVWEMLVETFGARRESGRPGREVWRGWMMDGRVGRRVEAHRVRVEALREREKEGEAREGEGEV